MTEMLERMISAMHEAKQKRSATKEDVARAALEALREPTPSVMDAMRGKWNSSYWPTDAELKAILGAGISAALGEDDG